MKIEIKRFKLGQEQLVCQIHNEAFDFWIRKMGPLYGYHKIQPKDVLSGLDISNDSNSPLLTRYTIIEKTIWLAYVNKTAVGYVNCQLEQNQNKNNTLNLVYEETKESLGQSKIAVLSKFRRKGVAKTLLEKTMEYYRAHGAVKAEVIAYNDNSPITALMSALGFERDEFYAVLAEYDLTHPLKEIRLNQDIIIRKLQESDFEGLRKVYGECRPDVFGLSPTFQQIYEWYTKAEQWAEVTLVAEYKGEVVGCMEFTSSGLIGIPGVLPAYRNKGIGSTLFYHLLKTMQVKGKNKALADTGNILPDAIKMYEHFDFDVSRRQWVWFKNLK